MQTTSLSSKRLLRDLNELYSSPLDYISAAPYNNDLYCWHANILGSVDSPYEGTVFHLILDFPQEYPNKPPKVTLRTQIERQFVYGNKICIDILETFKTNEKSTGWSSSYSISSILLQIQSYLFDKDEFLQMNSNKQMNIKNSIQMANNLQCSCGHDMKWQHPFPTHDKFKYQKTFFFAYVLPLMVFCQDQASMVAMESILLIDDGVCLFCDELTKNYEKIQKYMINLKMKVN